MEEQPTSIQSFALRINIALAGIGLLALILIIRVGYLQVYRFEEYQTQSQGNRLQVLPTNSVRGRILDRHGELIAGHSTTFQLLYYPLETSVPKHLVIELLERTLGLTTRERRLIEQANRRQSQNGIVIRDQLSEEEIARVAAFSFINSGLDITSRLSRYYPEGDLLGHLSGYVGKISEKDQERINADGQQSQYWGIHYIGKTGLERQYEDDLRGVPGSRSVEVNALGRVIRVLNEQPPRPGKDLVTTIDLSLQRKAHALFGGKNGAMVVMNPNNGEILVMISESGYDPNVFIEENNAAISALLSSPSSPMINRAIAGVYPPASTFKPFVGVTGLALGKRDVHETIFDPGYFSLPNSSHRYRDWKAGGHGTVNFHTSLTQSVDTYYYGLAVSIGIDNLHESLLQFGFGAPVGIDLPNERSGLLPSPAWKKKVFRTDWFPGDTVSVGIGQGYMLATPLQMAYAYAMLATGGKGYLPHLRKAQRDPINGIEEQFPTSLTHHIAINPSHWQAVTKALVGVNVAGGTAARAFSGAPFAVAGKTGTAQVFTVAQNQRYEKDKIRHELHDHAWYVGYAPAEKPEIVVAVILENAGGGSSNAAPLVRAMMDTYFNDTLKHSQNP